MNKRQKAIYECYEQSDLYDLYDAYNTTSGAKRRAWWGVNNDMQSVNGWGLKIISYNTCMFSIGYLYRNKAGALMFHYETNATRDEWQINEGDR